MTRRFALIACACLFAVLSVGPALAQSETPVAGPNASKSLPPAKNLGAGWSLSATISPDILSPYSFTMSPDVFREGAAGIYLGPQGAQVIFVSLLISTNRVAIRQSWDDANSLVSASSSMIRSDYEKTDALKTMDPPKGCVEANRTIGTEYFVGIPVASTVCAVDPDGILIALVIGEVGGKSGTAAADAVIETAVNGVAIK